MKPSMQGDQQDSVMRHKSLESCAQGKLAHAVRGGADGKGPRKRDLAGGLLHLERGERLRGPTYRYPMQFRRHVSLRAHAVAYTL